MSKFTEKKQEIKEKAASSNRKTFNEQEFNEMATALINEHDYGTTIAQTVKGEYSEKEILPVEELRKSLIGSVAKAAGCDTADQARLIKEHQFPTLPIYGYIAEAVENYMDAGKAFAFLPKDDMRGTIYIESQEETVKEVKSPKTQEVSKRRYLPYRKIKTRSNCPQNRRLTEE